MLSINLVFLKSVSDMAAILRITNFFHTLPLKLSRQVVVKSNYYDRYSKGEFTFSFSTRIRNFSKRVVPGANAKEVILLCGDGEVHLAI